MLFSQLFMFLGLPGAPRPAVNIQIGEKALYVGHVSNGTSGWDSPV